MGNEPKICIADDDQTALERTARWIRAEGYSVVVCQSREDLFQAVNEGNLFCILVDANLLEVNELSLLSFQHQPRLPVIFTAKVATVATSVEAMKAGAIDFLIQPTNLNRLKTSICEAMCKYQKSRELALALRKFGSLTQREKEVFEFVTTGLLNKQIAACLGISEKTIKVHRGRVMGKMEVQSLAELVRLFDKLPPTVKVIPNRAFAPDSMKLYGIN